jgi:Brp/Blh family beta-carotene 15,15'-monooxygenase
MTSFRFDQPRAVHEDVAEFHDDAVFRPVVAVTLTITALAAVWSTPDWLSGVAVFVVIAALGIPHGAMDHLALEALDGAGAPRRRARFVAAYLAAMAAVALVWLAAPPLALVAFLVISIHHFGQSDLAHLRLGGRRQLVVQWSRGLFLIGLLLVAHIDEVAPTLGRLGGGDPAGWGWLVETRWWWCALLVVQHLAIGAAVARRVGDRTVVAREAITVAVLTLLFVTVDPLLAFAVYFGLWHSLAHLLVLADLLGTAPHPVRSVARLAAPLTATSLGGLAVASGTAVLLGRTELLVPIAIVFVSMLTVPHMVVVERMWRRPRASGNPDVVDPGSLTHS